MQSYILHLARSTERDGLVKDLIELLPNAHVLPSVEGAALTVAERDAAYQVKQHKPHYPFSLKAAEIGCFLSHRNAWKSLVDSDACAAWVVEDDLAISDENFKTLSALVSPHITEDVLIRVPLKDREVAHETIDQKDGMTLMRPEVIALSAAFYILGRKAAQRLLTLTDPFDRPVDTFIQMRWVTEIDTLVVKDSGARTAAFDVGTSTIQSKKSITHEVKRVIPRAVYRSRVKKLSAKSI
jgi:GR25 family glycosyltransferase involved in LPS biosynthesis